MRAGLRDVFTHVSDIQTEQGPDAPCGARANVNGKTHSTYEPACVHPWRPAPDPKALRLTTLTHTGVPSRPLQDILATRHVPAQRSPEKSLQHEAIPT